MKPFLLCSALLLLASAPLFADALFAPWEAHSGGTDLKMTLGTQMVDGISKTTIRLDIKNTSRSSEYYKGPDRFNLEMAIIILKQDKESPLRKYDLVGSYSRPPEIKPGDTLSRTIILSPDELARIAGNPIKCRVGILVISDSKLVKRYIIDSSPNVLVESPQ